MVEMIVYFEYRTCLFFPLMMLCEGREFFLVSNLRVGSEMGWKKERVKSSEKFERMNFSRSRFEGAENSYGQFNPGVLSTIFISGFSWSKRPVPGKH